jgi:hypothetical protein
MRDGRPTSVEFKLLQFFGGNPAHTDASPREFAIQAA